jgi:tRNA(adenine34) deaminase
MGISPTTDEAWMRYAFRLAQRAGQQGEVPVGAIVVKDDQCVAEGWNAPITTHDPTAHADVNQQSSIYQ